VKRSAPGSAIGWLLTTSVYPWFCSQTSNRPSLSVSCTVVLRIIAPQFTQPLLLEVGTTDVVWLPNPGPETFMRLPTGQVGLSQAP